MFLTAGYRLISPAEKDLTTGSNGSEKQTHGVISKMQLSKKCGFPLAEDERSRKRFSHTRLDGSMGLSILGVFRSLGVSEFSSLCCLLPLTCPTHPHSTCFWGCCSISCSALVLVIVVC